MCVHQEDERNANVITLVRQQFYTEQLRRAQHCAGVPNSTKKDIFPLSTSCFSSGTWSPPSVILRSWFSKIGRWEEDMKGGLASLCDIHWEEQCTRDELSFAYCNSGPTHVPPSSQRHHQACTTLCPLAHADRRIPGKSEQIVSPGRRNEYWIGHKHFKSWTLVTNSMQSHPTCLVASPMKRVSGSPP